MPRRRKQPLQLPEKKHSCPEPATATPPTGPNSYPGYTCSHTATTTWARRPKRHKVSIFKYCIVRELRKITMRMDGLWQEQASLREHVINIVEALGQVAQLL